MREMESSAQTVPSKKKGAIIITLALMLGKAAITKYARG